MRLTSGQPAESSGFDMTPMIDIVFQLIIFFVTVSELSKSERMALDLPVADQANPDTQVESSRLVVNMTRGGWVHFTGKGPMRVGAPEVERILRQEACASLGGGALRPTRQVVLRGEKNLEFRHVQEFMMRCRRVGIWRIELQTDLPPEVRVDI